MRWDAGTSYLWEVQLFLKASRPEQRNCPISAAVGMFRPASSDKQWLKKASSVLYFYKLSKHLCGGWCPPDRLSFSSFSLPLPLLRSHCKSVADLADFLLSSRFFSICGESRARPIVQPALSPTRQRSLESNLSVSELFERRDPFLHPWILKTGMGVDGSQAWEARGSGKASVSLSLLSCLMTALVLHACN